MVLTHGMVVGKAHHLTKQLTSLAYDYLLVAHSLLFKSKLNSSNIAKETIDNVNFLFSPSSRIPSQREPVINVNNR